MKIIPNVDTLIDGTIRSLDEWKKRRERKRLAQQVGNLLFDDAEVHALVMAKLKQKTD